MFFFSFTLFLGVDGCVSTLHGYLCHRVVQIYLEPLTCGFGQSGNTTKRLRKVPAKRPAKRPANSPADCPARVLQKSHKSPAIVLQKFANITWVEESTFSFLN